MSKQRLSISVVVFTMLVAWNALATTSLSGSYFTTIWDIYSGAGTRVSATAVGSGYPVIASSWPEYVGSEGYMYNYSSLSTQRFRHFMYHVNETGSAKYMGFAIKNLGSNSINIWVNHRGHSKGSGGLPARVGRDAQYRWYNTSSADYYVTTLPAGSWWFSSSSSYFLTSQVQANELYQGIYDMAVVDNVTGGNATIQVVSYATSSNALTSPPSTQVAAGSTGTMGFNLYCPYSTLTFDVLADVTSSNFKYFDLHNNGALNAGESICSGYRSSSGVDGNYGVEYVLNVSVTNNQNNNVHWAATVANSYCAGAEQHYVGVTTSPGSSDILGQTSSSAGSPSGAGGPMIPFVAGTSYDRGIELATANGSHSGQIRTQVVGGDCSPVRIYFFRD